MVTWLWIWIQYLTDTFVQSEQNIKKDIRKTVEISLMKNNSNIQVMEHEGSNNKGIMG